MTDERLEAIEEYGNSGGWMDTSDALRMIRECAFEIRQLRADLEWLAEFHYDKLDVNEGKYYWRYDHTNAEYNSIHEAIAAKRKEVAHA